MSGASWLFLVFTQISLEQCEQIQDRSLFHGVFWVLWKCVFGHVFFLQLKSELLFNAGENILLEVCHVGDSFER